MSDFRVLLAPEGLEAAHLAGLYAVPAQPWFRANMVSTVNGAAAGPDARSGTINNAIDTEVFHLLRAQADAIVVGAGTARAEGYRPTDRPVVVVTRSGAVPPTLQDAPPGSVLIATHAAAPELAATHAQLGADQVLVLGADRVDLQLLRTGLVDRGLENLLCEGGPGLLRDALAAGIVDELCLTWVPLLLAGETQRLLTGAPLELALTLGVLLERDGTLLGRWWTRADPRAALVGPRGSGRS